MDNLHKKYCMVSNDYLVKRIFLWNDKYFWAGLFDDVRKTEISCQRYLIHQLYILKYEPRLRVVYFV